MSERAPHSERTLPRDPIARTLVNLLRLTVGLVFVLFFSLVIQLGMAWWTGQGSQHSRTLLAQEVGYLSEEFKDSVLTANSTRMASDILTKTESWFSSIGLVSALEWARNRLTRLPDANESGLQVAVRRGLTSAGDYLVTLVMSVQLFAVRVTVLLLALPAFFLFGAVGLADGLARRDLRRWGGGRESGFVYHHAKRLVMPTLFLLWLIYLLSPWSLHPSLIVVPFAALFGLTVAIAAATFKKYL